MSASVAVVIPSYNSAAFIRAALDSVVRQSCPVTRVIVVDDGSTDDSIDVVSQFVARWNQVTVVRTPTNIGPGGARNLGVSVADESLIAFLDADDVWDHDHVARLVELLDHNPAAVLGFADARISGGGAATPELRAVPNEAVDLTLPLVYDNPIPQSAVMVRRDAFVRAGGYLDGMRHSEDYDLWLRLAELGPFVTSGVATCTRRLHAAQATNQASKMFRGAWAARGRTRERRAAHLDGDDLARLDAILALAFDRDLTWAWQSRSRRIVVDVLDLANGFPFLAAVARRWRRRLHLYWPAWRVAAGVWDAVPEQLRARLRTSPLLRARARTRRLDATVGASDFEESA